MACPQEFARLLMEVADRAYLTTIAADGFPHTRAILNLRNPSLYPSAAAVFAPHREDFLIYVTTNTSSLKVRQVIENPRGSVYYCHPTRYRGVLMVGRLRVVDDATLRRNLWVDGWEMYYPQGPNDPDHTILALEPHIVMGWDGEMRFEFEVPD